MKCEDVRALLLEAEMAELVPEGATPLAAHLRACPRCAAAATDVRRAMAALDVRLSAGATEEAVDAVMALLGHAAEGNARVRPFPSRRRRTPAWVPVALAAGVAALLIVPRLRSPDPGDGARLAASAPALPLVEMSGSATVAVIETDNPDITVLWFF